jgi:hypothetical protein
LGFDDDHAFSKSASFATGSWVALIEAARLVDEVGADDGTAPLPPDIPALQDDLRNLIASVARQVAVSEIEEAERNGGVSQTALDAANALVDQGDGLTDEAITSDDEQKLVDAIAAYREAYESLVALLHEAYNQGERGDVDCDADKDAVDALHILREVAALAVSAGCLFNADLDCNLEITVVDALFSLRGVAGLPISLPEGCPTPAA